jgi:hypothetical protein
MSTLSRTREEESEETEKTHQRVEEEEEEKEDPKDKLQNNKLQPNKLLNNQPPEHVLCELLFNPIQHLFYVCPERLPGCLGNCLKF